MFFLNRKGPGSKHAHGSSSAKKAKMCVTLSYIINPVETCTLQEGDLCNGTTEEPEIKTTSVETRMVYVLGGLNFETK